VGLNGLGKQAPTGKGHQVWQGENILWIAKLEGAFFFFLKKKEYAK
jgi:hypothetical protein